MSKDKDTVKYTVTMQLHELTEKVFKSIETGLATIKVDISDHIYGDFKDIPLRLVLVSNADCSNSNEMELFGPKEKWAGRNALEFDVQALIQPIRYDIELFYAEVLTDIQNNRINEKHPCRDKCEHAREIKKDPYLGIFEQTYDVPMKDLAVEIPN